MDCATVSQQVFEKQREIERTERELEDCDAPRCIQLEGQLENLESQLSSLQQYQTVCQLLVGPWAFNGNGFTGTLTITSGDIQEDGTTFFSGNAVIDAPNIDSISGTYADGTLTFTRTSPTGRIAPQSYIGFRFANPTGTAHATFAGTFTESDLMNATFGWFMIKN